MYRVMPVHAQYVENGPPPPPCEDERMITLRALQMSGAMAVDAPPDPEIESILKLVASIFDAPHALVALFDDKRIFVRETNPGGRGFARGDFPWCGARATRAAGAVGSAAWAAGASSWRRPAAQ